jgi:hypothetical protein
MPGLSNRAAAPTVERKEARMPDKTKEPDSIETAWQAYMNALMIPPDPDIVIDIRRAFHVGALTTLKLFLAMEAAGKTSDDSADRLFDALTTELLRFLGDVGKGRA